MEQLISTPATALEVMLGKLIPYFPIDAMPKFLQWLTVINPLRYFLVALRFRNSLD